MEPRQVYDNGIRYHHYANTAYPLTPKSFRAYRIDERERIPAFLAEQWAKAPTLSVYVHVPFCQVRCKFCEYVVVGGEDAAHEEEYVDLLLREIALYQPLVQGKRVVGFDVGGGTPTKLAVPQLERITDAVRGAFALDPEMVFSIETTPVIAAREPEKLAALFAMGYRRISMGVQTVSEKLLNELGREGAAAVYERATTNIRAAGFTRFNIDLMYGFLHQSDEDFEHTVRYAIGLGPEYITLYRNRYKGTRLEDEAGGVSLYRVMRQYRLAFDLLNAHGYAANLGKNTFSRVANDYGTSDYLTRRVVDGVPYLGLGLGAQSMGIDYLAYNEGAATKQLARYRQQLGEGQFPLQDLYDLPAEESIAKMVSVAFYFGFVDLPAFHARFGRAFADCFPAELDFVHAEGLMELEGSRLMLTERGADHINGVIPLFYSERSKLELASLLARRPADDGGERRFLEAYKLESYARPSLTVDLVVLGVDAPLPVPCAVEPAAAPGQELAGLSVVLVRRGDHPFMNHWALPGGFVRPGESVEQAAARELREEAGLHDLELEQLRLFSAPQRDPRGWIVSCAFLAVAATSSLALRYGDDALDARRFAITLNTLPSEQGRGLELTLSGAGEELRAELVATKGLAGTSYTVTSSSGFAFDHAAIIAYALDAVAQRVRLVPTRVPSFA